jgi:ribonuclease P protein subunit RPR2
MEWLFRLAHEEALGGRLERANRYAALARRIGMRYNVPLPRKYRGRVCKGCHRYLLPGVTARVRLGRGRVVVTCAACGRTARHGYGREQKARRRQ